VLLEGLCGQYYRTEERSKRAALKSDDCQVVDVEAIAVFQGLLVKPPNSAEVIMQI
jgi:hypothetical protein